MILIILFVLQGANGKKDGVFEAERDVCINPQIEQSLTNTRS
jgi:hypothetical protein